MFITEQDDRSLLGTGSTGPTGSDAGVPNFTPGKVLGDINPRHGNSYFNISLFSVENLGQMGNANRRFFHGPGLNNWDLGLFKELKLTEIEVAAVPGRVLQRLQSRAIRHPGRENQ